MGVRGGFTYAYKLATKAKLQAFQLGNVAILTSIDTYTASLLSAPHCVVALKPYAIALGRPPTN